MLCTSEAGTEYDTGLELCQEAKLDKILQCTRLGGREEWTIETFLNPGIWDELGGQAGLKENSKKFLTLIVAGGQKDKPVNALCDVCGELRVLAKGDRMNLTVIARACLKASVEEQQEQQAAKRQRVARGMNELDTTCLGIMQTYERKLQLIETRYPDKTPTEIITKMLRTNVDIDEVSSAVTGEQGGKMLVCYLHHLYEDKPDEAPFLEDGIKEWLEEQLKKYPICFPVQKSCIEQAIKFYPKLIRGLDEYSRNGPRPAPAPAPDPDFGGPYHSRNHNPPPVNF